MQEAQAEADGEKKNPMLHTYNGDGDEPEDGETGSVREMRLSERSRSRRVAGTNDFSKWAKRLNFFEFGTEEKS